MPKHTEPQANGELRRLLDRMLPAYKATAENTQQIVGNPGLQPDILITAPGRAPVVIEAEFMPAYTAESEAKDRLGLEVVGAARHIDAAIAIRYPDGVADAPSLGEVVRTARLSYAAVYADDTRFPESGWLEGTVEDLSDDTGLGECLVVVRKAPAAKHRSHFVSLGHRPNGFAESAAIAKQITDTREAVRGIEDGPYGGTPLTVGENSIGETLNATLPASGGVWGTVRLKDASVAQTAFALPRLSLWLPGLSDALNLKTASLNRVGKLGLVDRDITGPAPRGPFDKIAPSPTSTYPSLWNHNAKKETHVVCEPDSQLQARQGMETKAAQVWSTASRTHLNRDLRFNSQPLAIAFTERESIGGRAWPDANFDDKRFNYAFAVWGNSALGLQCYWWHSSRQQDGRGRMKLTPAGTLPTLDLRALTDAQLATAKSIFDDFRDRELMPAYLADADSNRALLDRRVVCDLLGFDDDTYRAVRLLAAKWCAEPSVHGGKRRPDGAGLVV